MSRLVHAVAALERTALAWERTALGVGAVGLLMVKVAPGRAAAVTAGLLLVAVAVAVALLGAPLGYHRTRRRLEIVVERDSNALPFDPWRSRALLAVAVATTAAALLAAGDLLLG